MALSAKSVLEDFRELTGQTETKDIGGFGGTVVRLFNIRFYDGNDPLEEFVNVSDVGYAIATGGYIPLLWEEFPFDPWMYCVSKVPSWVSPGYWELTCNFSRVEEPLRQADVWNYDTSITNEPVDAAYDGTPLANSAHEPFDPPIQIDVADVVMHVTFNRETRIATEDYINTVNSDTFTAPDGTSYTAGKLKIKIFNAVLTRAAGLEYYAHTIEIHVREDKWERSFLDQGLRTLSGGDYTLILDEAGTPITTPVKLNGSGGVWVSGDAQFLTFDLENTSTYADLGL